MYACTSDDFTMEEPEENRLADRIVELFGETSALILPESDQYTAIPADPRNPITAEKVRLGKFLFHETALGVLPKREEGRNTYSCASCHHSKAGFQSGVIQGLGEGGVGFGMRGEARIKSEAYHDSILDKQPIRSPSILNVAFQDVMLWNGQFGAVGTNAGTEAFWTVDTPKEKNNLGFEGVETQAIAAIDVHRLDLSPSLINDTQYKKLFDDAFPDIPENERYTKITAGLAMAAYERTVMPTEAPFQKWLKGDAEALSEKEINGALLFYGKGACYTCHSGPGLNGMEFHALGMKDLAGPGVHGEIDEPTKQGRGGFNENPEDFFKFKVPQLYNLKDVRFFGHGGSFPTIRAVVEYKNRALPENREVHKSVLSDQFVPLNLTESEIEQLVYFIENALYDPNLDRFVPEKLPSGHCFPNADETSKSDLGCE